MKRCECTVFQQIGLEKKRADVNTEYRSREREREGGSKSLQMECIHSALQSTYTHNQQQITLLLRSVEANHKLSVCVIREGTNTASAWKETLKSICLGCTTIYHMTDYRTIDTAGYRHTHTHAYCLWDAFHCHQWKHCSCISRGTHLHENKQMQLDQKASGLEGERLACVCKSTSENAMECIFREKLSCLNRCENE